MSNLRYRLKHMIGNLAMSRSLSDNGILHFYEVGRQVRIHGYVYDVNYSSYFIVEYDDGIVDIIPCYMVKNEKEIKE